MIINLKMSIYNKNFEDLGGQEDMFYVEEKTEVSLLSSDQTRLLPADDRAEE